MAKKTAVIDLGSNSIRMVVFEKSSRYAFYICNEYKQKIRLAKNCYSDDKSLDETSMKEALSHLAYFKKMAAKHKCRKILAVGTQALRDIANSKDFIKLVKNKIGINIKCVSGQMESYLGGLAALNLLANIKDATAIDVGGGSTELCLIKNGKITKCLSLELGTVRLKELFGGYKNPALKSELKKIMASIPKDFQNDNIIAIGGSLRAISNSIMKKNSYPFRSIHNFIFNYSQEKKHIMRILNSKDYNLSSFSIKKDRFDTIKEGCIIFIELLKILKGQKIITSGVGVREGVYLNDILNKKIHRSGLKSQNIPIFTPRFPQNFNPSLKSIEDRFTTEKNKLLPVVSKLYEVINKKIKLSYKNELLKAAKLAYIGERVSYYFANEHAYYLAINSLAFGFSHEEKILIAMLLKLNGKKINDYLLDPYKKILCSFFLLSSLNFILALSKHLVDNEDIKLDFSLEDEILIIHKEKLFYSSLDELKKISRPSYIKKLKLVIKA